MSDEKPMEENEDTAPSGTSDDGANGDAEESMVEAFGAMDKLGTHFDRAVKSIRPRDIVKETQKGHRAAFFRNFKGQRAEKFTRPFMVEVLRKEIFDRQNLFMAHLLMVLWNEANRELYLAMRSHVETINENVEEIEEIEDDKAREFLDDLLSNEFSLEDIYICVRMNEVRFTEGFITQHVTPPSPAA